MKTSDLEIRFCKKILGALSLLSFSLLILLQSCKATDLHITAKAGGVYMLPATLSDTHIIITGRGSSSQPFVINGVSGKTELRGDSYIRIMGDYIIVNKVSFINNNINFLSSQALMEVGTKKQLSNHVTIRDCSFNYTGQFNDLDKASQFYWILISGKGDLVDNCVFEGKQNRLPVIHVNAFNWDGDSNIISNCTFQNVKPRVGEALEAIRVGLGNARSNCRILNNKFINYAGDSETISCKSNGVTIASNYFKDCRSGVSLRLSDSSIIENNRFVNTTWPVRISGIGHTITKNVFDSPTSSITFMTGGANCVYKAVNGININDNVFVGKIILKVLRSGKCDVAPVGLNVQNNYLYTNSLFKITDADFNATLRTTPSSEKLRSDGVREMEFGVKNIAPSTEASPLEKVTTYLKQKTNQ